MQFFSIQIFKLLEFILTKSRKPCFALQETMSKAFTSLFLKRFTHKDLVTNYHQHGTNIAGLTEHASCQPVVHIYKRTASANASASAFLTKLPFQNAALRLLQAIEQRVGALRMKILVYIYILKSQEISQRTSASFSSSTPFAMCQCPFCRSKICFKLSLNFVNPGRLRLIASRATKAWGLERSTSNQRIPTKWKILCPRVYNTNLWVLFSLSFRFQAFFFFFLGVG